MSNHHLITHPSRPVCNQSKLIPTELLCSLLLLLLVQRTLTMGDRNEIRVELVEGLNIFILLDRVIDNTSASCLKIGRNTKRADRMSYKCFTLKII